MDSEERYFEERRKTRRILTHMEACVGDVVGLHPDQSIKIDREELEEVLETVEDTLEIMSENELVTDEEYRYCAEQLIDINVTVSEKLREWHNIGLNDRFSREHSAGQSSNRNSGNDDTQIFDP